MKMDLRNQLVFEKIISESFNMLDRCQELLENKNGYALKEIQRLVHTIKGNFSYFDVQEVTGLCHELESFLEPHYNEQYISEELNLTVLEKVMSLRVSLECYIEHYENIIQYEEVSSRSIHKFFKTTVGTYFQVYPSIVSELGQKLGKEVKFKLIGENLEIPDGPWENIFQQFVHFIRNSVDHGIETPGERVSAGKAAHGEITFMFDVIENVNGGALVINLKDDGRGVDWNKLATKDSSITCMEDALEKIKTGGISSKDEVSDTSGRGVGVSSMFHTIERIGGFTEFKSIQGQGMSIKVTLPFKILNKNKVKPAA